MISEERLWEIARQVAKSLVENEVVQPPDLLINNQATRELLDGVLGTLGVSMEEFDLYQPGNLSRLTGKINPELAKLWAS